MSAASTGPVGPLDEALTPEGVADAGVDAVFLVWREPPEMLARHCAAVAAALGPGWDGRAVLVENGAAPASAAAARHELQRAFPDAELVVLRSARNLGFARAMDLALDACTRPLVAVLNSDGWPEPDTIDRLVAALAAHPRAVAVAPAVHGPGEDDQPPGPPYAEERLPGTALVARRGDFLAAGGFDPAYFFYNEDDDASRRLRAAGHELLRVPDAVYHHGKDGRSWRGDLLREWHYARTAQLLALQHGESFLPALGRLAGRRAASLTDHARHGRSAAVLGITAATLELPRSAALAVVRRRRPWDGARLAAWLEQARRDVRVERPVDPVSRRTDRPRPASPADRGGRAPARGSRRA